jgi:hypothetical protein
VLDRTLRTQRSRFAHCGTEIHHRLVPQPRLTFWKQFIGGDLSRSRRQTFPRQAAQYPRNVGVDDSCVVLECERHDCPGGVRPDSRESNQFVERSRDSTSMFRDDHSSSTVKIAGATRVPKSLPHSQNITQFRLGTRSNFWEFGDERLPLSEHT